MAVNFDNIAKRIFQILKSRGFHLKMYQEDGEVAYDPEKEARKFYVEDEGIMVSINETGERSEIKVYISDESDIQKLKTMLQSLRQAASFFGVNYNLRKYGKRLTPKEFSFLAYKSKKDEEEMNESSSYDSRSKEEILADMLYREFLSHAASLRNFAPRAADFIRMGTDKQFDVMNDIVFPEMEKANLNLAQGKITDEIWEWMNDFLRVRDDLFLGYIEMKEATKNPAAKSLSQFKPQKTKTKKEKTQKKDKWDRKAKHRDRDMKETIEVFEARDISVNQIRILKKLKKNNGIYKFKFGVSSGLVRPSEFGERDRQGSYALYSNDLVDMEIGETERHPNGNWSREVEITLTPKGEQMIKKLFESSADKVVEAKDISNLWGSTKSSYQKVGEGKARMVVRHAKPVDENKFAARTRNIQKIFIENTEGERIKFPVNWLQGARAMTRHISEGGTWDDDVGTYIRNVAEEFRNLKRFTKHAHRDLNEDASEVVGIIRNRTKQIAQEMKKLQGPMSYRRFVESFEPGSEVLLGEDNLSVEVNRLRGIFNISEEWDGIDESFNSVALITSNSDRVDELRDKVSVEQQVQNLLSKGEVHFLPKENYIEMPKDRKERVATLLGDLASRARNDEVSVFLSRLVDQISMGEMPSKEDMALATQIVKASKVSESVSKDENRDIGMFVEWADQFDPLKILLKEDGDEKEKKVEKRNKEEKKKAKQNKESVVYVNPHRQEHYKDGKQVRITDPSKVGRLAEAAKKGGANYAKAKAGGFYKDDVSAFDSLDTSDEEKLRRSLEAKGVPSHRIEQAVAAHKKRKGVSEKVNESEIIRIAELAGLKKRVEVNEVEADPYGGSMISPYVDEPNDADYERAYDIMLDFVEEEIRKQGVIDLEELREVLPDVISDVFGRLEAEDLGYFEKPVIKNAVMDKASAMGFDTNEDISVKFDDKELKHDIVTKPGTRQKFKRDPKNVMDRYRKKQ